MKQRNTMRIYVDTDLATSPTEDLLKEKLSTVIKGEIGE